MRRLPRRRPRRQPDADAFARPFAARVFNARRRLRIPRAAVARLCDVSEGVVKAWEMGQLTPDDPDAVLSLLADAKRARSRKKDVDAAWPAQLRDLRVSRGLTQRDVAEEIGRSQASVSLWEAGTVQPNRLKRSAVLELIREMAESRSSGRGRKPAPAGRRMG